MENTIVNINYEQTGASTGTNPLGMREMQAKVYEAREKQYLLVKEDYPDKTLQKYTVDEMTSFVQPLLDEGFKIQIRG